MSIIFDEEVFPMPATSMATLEVFGREVLEELFPDRDVDVPIPLDAVYLLSAVLPKKGIYVYSASREYLDGRVAATMPLDSKSTQILLAEDLYDDLLDGGKKANFARTTFAHELAHAILHIPVIRRKKKLADKFGLAMNRVARRKLEAYVDPEWQAFALGGCLLMPRWMIELLSDRSAENVARVFEVSEAMARSHLRRLKMEAR